MHSWLCREVVATEVAKASVAAAKYNLEANQISNVHIARLSSEEFTQAWRGDRDFFRLKDLPSVKDRKFHTLLVRGAPFAASTRQKSNFRRGLGRGCDCNCE